MPFNRQNRIGICFVDVKKSLNSPKYETKNDNFSQQIDP